MHVVAHRGFADEAAENTLAALERAAGLADAVEVDVRRCGSGEPVVVHDETVDRVTDASGPVAEFTAAELRSLDVLGSGEGIPTLAAVVDALPDDRELFVELKESGLAADALEVLDDRDGRTVVTSFDPAVVAAVRDLDPDVPRGLVANDLADNPVATAREVACDALLLQWSLAFVPWVYWPARRSGLEVYAWTVDRRLVARACSVLGVDGAIVDARRVVV